MQLLPEWALSPIWDENILVLRSVLSFDDQTFTNISSLQDNRWLIRPHWRSRAAGPHSRLPEDPELCPFQTFSEYFTKVRFLLWSIKEANFYLIRPANSTLMVLPPSFLYKASLGRDLTNTLLVDHGVTLSGWYRHQHLLIPGHEVFRRGPALEGTNFCSNTVNNQWSLREVYNLYV